MMLKWKIGYIFYFFLFFTIAFVITAIWFESIKFFATAIVASVLVVFTAIGLEESDGFYEEIRIEFKDEE